MKVKRNIPFIICVLLGVTSTVAFADEVSEPSVANLALGLMYKDGVRCAKDLVRAEQYFLLSANAGNPIAQHELAIINSGRVKSQDDNAANSLIKWLALSANGGCAEAQFELGTCYASGIFVERDYTKSMELFGKAADRGSIKARYNIALAYETGTGVTRDAGIAASYYLTAANQGLPLAQFKIGTKYLKGDGVPVDLKRAIEWLEKSAESGCEWAHFNLGIAYRDGVGVKQNLNRSIFHISLAANKGLAVAERELGVMYEKGLGAMKDQEESLVWLNRAAMHGNTMALAQLAFIYRGSKEREVFAIKAYAYAAAAQKRGYANANTLKFAKGLSDAELERAKIAAEELESKIDDFQSKFITLK